MPVSAPAAPVIFQSIPVSALSSFSNNFVTFTRSSNVDTMTEGKQCATWPGHACCRCRELE